MTRKYLFFWIAVICIICNLSLILVTNNFTLTELVVTLASSTLLACLLSQLFYVRFERHYREQDSVMRKLETVRRDFVANVSHELKTPITSIKGFVETLLDGALNNPEDARRFLLIVSRQADRLNQIFEDLLTLSRLEQEGDRFQIMLESQELEKVMRAAVQNCEHSAQEKQISIELHCPADVKTRINENLLEQAVANLIDNAIKYSDAGSRVKVSTRRTPNSHGSIEICVEDSGCGIEVEHQSRIFERFYRVDKARSRKVGGTGLGLAIVKHIAQVHGGVASVQSVPGKGSAFIIQLPELE